MPSDEECWWGRGVGAGFMRGGRNAKACTDFSSGGDGVRGGAGRGRGMKPGRTFPKSAELRA